MSSIADTQKSRDTTIDANIMRSQLALGQKIERTTKFKWLFVVLMLVAAIGTIVSANLSVLDPTPLISSYTWGYLALGLGIATAVFTMVALGLWYREHKMTELFETTHLGLGGGL